MNRTGYALTVAGMLAFSAIASPSAFAQQARAGSAAGLWQNSPAARAAVPSSAWAGRLTAYRATYADPAALATELRSAPLEGRPGAAPLILTLPTPDGGSARFQVVEAPVMEPGLAAQFPQIKTYAGSGLDDPTATLRADITPQGFHAQVLSRQPGGTFYIDPIQDGNPARGLVVYDRRNLVRPASQAVSCMTGTPGTGTTPVSSPSVNSNPGNSSTGQRVTTSLGGTLRTYRLAVAATGEYTAFHGGTVTLAQAAIVTTVNRVTGVYEKELAVRLVLVANNSSLIYTNANTDPYTNTSSDLAANQTTITSVIGSANYDIGHLVGTGGGGVAGLGVVCNSTQKARGLTGSPSPVNDAFDIDYVAHEMGHQFSGNHPFNGSTGSCTGGNRNASTAWEPGSGSTIMAYAGICSPQDLQSNSDPYFHGGNISEMTAFITNTTTGGSCPTSAATGNTPPTVGTPANKSIPASTPFYLTGTATDADGDALTYDWEEMDLGAQGAPVTSTAQTANATVPLFRSWNPTTSPTRYFPRLNELRNNTVAYGEFLPSVARTMAFRLTVRDEHFSTSLNRIVGGVNQSGTVTLTVVNTGAAFAVTAPNTATSFAGGSSTTVTWNVAGTTANGINCATVNIKLSTDGGLTYPTTLVAGTANDGTESVALPNTPTTQARIMVEAADNYFFDISNANFTITSSTAPVITSFTPTSGVVGTVVTITGSNFTGATAVRFNGTNAASFTVNSATQITATVAAGSTTGPISVTNASGTGTSSGNFSLPSPPAITSFTPTSGGNGTVVTITGTDFAGATAVTFNGANAASFTVNSATQITATAPTGVTTGPIAVTTSLGTGTGATFTSINPPANDLCTAANLPVLTCGSTLTGTTTNSTSTGDPTASCSSVTIFPASGGVFYRFTGTGGSVTLSTCNAATNFDTELFVYTGSCGSLTCVTANDDQTGTCSANGTTTPSSVTFTSVAGTSYLIFVSGFNGAKGNFAISATCTPSTFTSFSPSSGVVGSSVTLTGTLLGTTSNVKFNGTDAAFTVASATSVMATVPAGANTGTISLTTGTGTYTSSTIFTVLLPPVINAQTFSLAENSANGTGGFLVVASDPNAGETLTYAITGGNTGGAFAINAVTGALTVANAAALDFETNPTFSLTVQVTDNGSTAQSASATVTVNLTNVNEGPTVAGGTYSLAENAANGTAVGSVNATDPDAGTTLSYTILSGNTGGAFAVTSTGGVQVANAAALDFEANPSFLLSIEATDGSLVAVGNVAITLTNVNETPTVGSFTPNTGGPGTVVTISGTNFQSAGAVTVAFNGTAAASVSVASGTSLTATVPTGATSGFITVTNLDGTGTSATVYSVFSGPAPTISSFSPLSAATGATVTINGTNLSTASAVTFNNVPAASFTVVSNMQVTAVVPANATTGQIRVTTGGGVATSAATFKVLPTLTSFTPSVGVPGTVVTITGSGFSGATQVKFNTTVTTAFTIVSPTTITVAVPATATTGKLAVVSAGGTATSVASFTVGPIVTGFIPAQGAPGSVVLVQGLNFVSGTTARFNGTAATTTYNSATQLTAIVPAAATTGPVSVTNASGTTSSTTNYTVVSGAYPTITSFTPTANVIAGTAVTITGTNFTGATLVRFNNVNAASFTVNSATSITATVPAGALTGKIYVANPSGMGQSASSLIIIQPPTITTLSPTSGAVGSVVLLGGTNLTGATSVTLNGAAVPYTVNSAAQIVATIPAGATSGKFAVTTIAGTALSTGTFTVSAGPAPTITSLSPTSGLRGSSVVITGTNFTGVTSVKLGALTCVYTVNSSTQITATVPSTATTNRFYVTTSGGGMAQSATYTVILAPTITSFTPTSGAAGTVVTINGTNYAGISSVKFGGVEASSFTIVSTAKLTAVVPSGALTGTITVTNAAGTATSAGSFTYIGPRPGSVKEPRVLEPVAVNLFPNPAHDYLTIQVTGGTTAEVAPVAELLDATGRVMLRQELANGTGAVAVANLPKGVYMVRVSGQVRRLVVE